MRKENIHCPFFLFSFHCVRFSSAQLLFSLHKTTTTKTTNECANFQWGNFNKTIQEYQVNVEKKKYFLQLNWPFS